MATIEESIKLQLARSTAEEVSYSGSIPCSFDSENFGCLQELGAETQIVAGNAGDNPLLLQFLVQRYQSPLAEDFQSRLDEPLYSPNDRLLLRRREQIIGHVQVTKQIAWFEQQRCPIARFQDFGTLPEYRTSGLDSSLLAVAESEAIQEGAILGFVRTELPEWFEQHGWSHCRGQGHTRANTRAVLAHLDAQQSPTGPASFMVRTWRHYELDAIMQIYQQLSTHFWGARHRSLEMWQWLMGRKAHDQILIAVANSSENIENDCSAESEQAVAAPDGLKILGYAIVRDSCIVEMLSLPGHAEVRAGLLARACRDAIDRDHHFVSLHTPAGDLMHELMVTSGGSWIADSATAGGEWMLKLLSPERWIERLYPVLHERARAAGISRRLQIDFASDSECLRFTLTRRSARLEPIAPSPLAVQCSWPTLQDLLLGNLTFPEAIAQGRLRSPHLRLLRILAALFPPKLLWHSPFPQLRL